MNHLKLLFKAIITTILLCQMLNAQAALPIGTNIVKNVNDRDEGQHIIQELTMTLINKRGKTQERNMVSYRKDYEDERKTILLYLSPANIKGTGFMSFDYIDDSKDDDQWLYLPALRKTRRISSSNRGDYFLGTDFTYEDIKLGTKLSKSDYKYSTVKKESIDGVECLLIEATPVSDEISRELGYKRVNYWVDSKIWMVRQVQYWDIAGNLLKTSHIKKISRIDGIWTFQALEAENHKTGHRTTINFSNTDYNTEVEDDLFSEESLMRGAR